MKIKLVFSILCSMLWIGGIKAQLKVGQEYQGGIIAHLDAGGKSGIIIEKNERKVNWTNAKTETTKLGASWRIPNQAEWKLIYKNQNTLKISPYYHWCSETVPGNKSKYFDINQGSVGEIEQSTPIYHRAILSFSVPKYYIGQEHLGGIIIVLNPDGNSGLVIQKTDLPKELSWFDAKTEVDKLGSGWRLPTIDELNQINAHNSILNLKNSYWSSTPHKKEEAWVFNFRYGKKFNVYQPFVNYVRAVK